MKLNTATVSLSATSGDLVLGGLIELNAKTLSVDASAGRNLTFSGGIGGTGTLKFTQGSSLLSGPNTFTASSVTLDSSANTNVPVSVDLGSNNSISVTGDTILEGKTGSLATLSISGGTYDATGQSILLSNAASNLAQFDIGGTTFVKADSLEAAQKGTGTVNQSGGTLAVTSTTASASTGFWLNHYANNAVGTYNLSGGELQVNTWAATNTGNATFNFSGGTIRPYSQNLAIGTGITLTGSNGVISSTDAAGTARTITINNAIGQDATGNRGITFAGGGTINLGASNTYTGETKINSGLVTLQSGGTLSSTKLNVAGGTFNYSASTNAALPALTSLKGAGTVKTPAGGTVSLASGGTLAAGNAGIGTLNVTGSLALNANIATEIELVASGTSDKTAVSGNLILGGTVKLADTTGGTAGGRYTIFTNGGTRSGSLAVDNAATSYHGVANTATAGSVYLDLYRLASANSIGTVNFGTVITGGTTSRTLSIQNTAANDGYSEKLDASIGSATSGFTAGGSFTALTAGSTNNSSLVVGMDTSAVGAKTGSATLALNSNGSGTSGYGTTALPTQTVNFVGDVLDHASGSLTASASFGTVITGASVANQSAVLSNAAGHRAGLQITSLGGLSGATLGDKITAGGSVALSAAVNTATVGADSQSYTVKTTDDTSIAGYTAQADKIFTVTGTVLDHAAGSVSVTSGNNFTVLAGAGNLSALINLTTQATNADGKSRAQLQVKSLSSGLTGSTGLLGYGNLPTPSASTSASPPGSKTSPTASPPATIRASPALCRQLPGLWRNRHRHRL